MGDQDDGQLQLTVDLGQQLQDRRSGLRVEGAGGFVAQQDLRVGGQCAGDADALLLAAGKLCRVLPGVVLQTDAGQQLGDALVDFAARQLAGQGQRQRDVVGDSLGRQQIEVLEDHPDLLAEAAQLVGIERGDVLAIDDDLAARRLFEAVDQAQHGALAGAGVADQAEHLAVFDGQAGRIQCGDFPTGNAVGFMYLLELDHVANLVGRIEIWVSG
ncbi:hypothetical protein D9M71_613880 [compost metagenome]